MEVCRRAQRCAHMIAWDAANPQSIGVGDCCVLGGAQPLQLIPDLLLLRRKGCVADGGRRHLEHLGGGPDIGALGVL